VFDYLWFTRNTGLVSLQANIANIKLSQPSQKSMLARRFKNDKMMKMMADTFKVAKAGQCQFTREDLNTPALQIYQYTSWN
jgi:hypothetical protein